MWSPISLGSSLVCLSKAALKLNLNKRNLENYLFRPTRLDGGLRLFERFKNAHLMLLQELKRH